jgi:aminotransferase
VISEHAVQTLSESLLRRGGEPVWVLHDEIYREQTFVENAGYFALHYPYTIVTNSVSKSNALTGLRLGWAMAPSYIAAQIVKVHAWLTSCADSFAQQVALHIFSGDALAEQTAWYAEQRSRIIPMLEASGLRFITPEGAFYACVDLPGVDSLHAAHTLADEFDVIAVPGVAFGSEFRSWLRLSWVGAPGRFGEGLSRIRAFAASLQTGKQRPDKAIS